MNYNVDYFIAKFEAIPEDKIVYGKLSKNDGHCANGWCGVRYIFNKATDESYGLYKIFRILANDKNYDSINVQYSEIAAAINNGKDERYLQPTPKQRILAALHDIKKLQQPISQVKEVIKYVTIDAPIREEAKQLVVN